MTIAPVRAEVEVRQPPAEAFALFTQRMGDWWQDSTPGDAPAASISLEPRAGGRWFETDADGHETIWGKVLEWEPHVRVLLSWEMNASFRHDPAVVTEIEITFAKTDSGGTRVSLEHRKLEAYGPDAERLADMIGNGWPKQLRGFAAFAQTRAPEPSQ